MHFTLTTACRWQNATPAYVAGLLPSQAICLCGDLPCWVWAPMLPPKWRPPRHAVPAGAVELAPLQRHLGHVLAQAHEQHALAVQDLQAPDVLLPSLREQLDLLQQAAA